jgi:hypothetical protein
MPAKMTEKLILAIVSYVYERGGLLSKTKLLKLLYLCDVEAFRAYGRRLTDLDWKFHHLGPWAATYDQALSVLVARNDLVEVTMENQEYDSTLYRSALPISQLRGTFATAQESFTVENVVHRWFRVPTPELLNFVYFHTEPMLHAQRGERLQFDTVKPETTPKFALDSSGTSRKDIQRARKKLQAKLASVAPKSHFKFTAPQYDEAFDEAMSKLDDLPS